MPISCHEFFGCKKKECQMFSNEETRNCWEVDAALTSCIDLCGELFDRNNKLAFCKNCLYYKHVHEKKLRSD